MDIFYDVASLRKHLKYHKSKNRKIGLVPTMGALHQGHMALVKKSLEENDLTCCSIYVNPTQFNNPTDLQKYPKTLEKDLQMLDSVGCQIVFVPNDNEIYPSLPSLNLNFGSLEHIMEGSFRPGHFNGVGIVVAKLFNIFQPDYAYFGQKDLQQFLIIKQMVRDLSFDLSLKSVPIQREPDGLAMSSRNARLIPTERAVAPQIYEALCLARKLVEQNTSIVAIRQQVRDFFEEVKEIRLEYFEVADGETLQPVSDLSSVKPIALCIAAYVGEVRLIDNLLLFS